MDTSGAMDFLHSEAALLDDWQLDDWLALFLPEGRYLVPTTTLPEGESPNDVVFIDDHMPQLEGRVARLKSRLAHREYPSSRTRRLVTNVRILDENYPSEGAENDRPVISVASNFIVYRFRMQQVAAYVGYYRHVLARDQTENWKILFRKATLDNEYLDEHGAVSIIL